MNKIRIQIRPLQMLILASAFQSPFSSGRYSYRLNERDRHYFTGQHPTQETDSSDGPVPERVNDSWRSSNRDKHFARTQRLAPSKNPSSLISKLVSKATQNEY